MKRSLLRTSRSFLCCGLLGFVPLVSAVHAQDTAAAAAQYGFAGRLPQDVEMFSSAYRLGDVWNAVANSQFTTALLNLNVVQQEPEIRRMLTDWRSDTDIQHFKQMAGALLGQEVAIVGAKGTAASLRGLLESLTVIQPLMLAGFTAQARAIEGDSSSAAGPDMAGIKTLLESVGGADGIAKTVTNLNPPPLLLVSRAGAAKEVIDALIAQGLTEAKSQLPPFVEHKEFTVGTYQFQSFSVSAAKALTPDMRAEGLTKLTEVFGDKAKAEKVLSAVSAKTAELAWGWVDDYFVVSIGPDHSHLKFASTPADSVLAVPALAKRLGAAGTHKPLGLAWSSKKVFEALDIPMQLAKVVDLVPAEVIEEYKIDKAAVAAELTKIDTATNTLLHREYTDVVSVAWLENGIRQETWGGPKHTGPAPAPLGFAGTRGPSTLLYIDGRSDWAPVRSWIETCASSLDKIYSEEVRPNLPPDAAQAAAIGEVMGRSVVSSVWKTIRSLGEALGEESALIVNLDGKMPPVPEVPSVVVKNVPVPRAAWVCQLKNRAKLTEAWKSFDPLVQQALSFMPADSIPGGRPKIITTRDGGIEMWSVKLPMDLGDLNPHIAATADRWIWSTSPDLTKKIAAAPAAAGEPLTWHVNVNFHALAGWADSVSAAIDKDPEAFFESADIAAAWKQQVKPDADTIRKLVRSLVQIDAKGAVEGGENRTSVHLQVEDID